MLLSDMIKCNYCTIEKQESEYYECNKIYCRKCLRTKQRERYRKRKAGILRNPLLTDAEKKERQRVYYRKWYAEKGRENRNRYDETTETWLKAHPEATKAKTKLHWAVKTGKLERPIFCDQCREIRKINAHHPDYTKPLEVIWLCHSCHKILHNNIK